MTMVRSFCVAGAFVVAAAVPQAAHAQCNVRSWFRDAQPPDAYSNAMTYDSLRHRVISFGGSSESRGQYLNETWSFDGTVWTQITTNPSPPGTSESHNIAYDSARDRVVKFGGASVPQNYETWEFDGTNWSRRALIGPLISSGMAMVYDAARQKTVLFGGYSLGSNTNQTWLWNGSSWTRAFPAHSPPGRNFHNMVYDSARQRVVMYGGALNDAPNSNDLWEWNGTDWTQITLPGPTGPIGGGLAYDTLRQRTHLSGNTFNGQEDWTYDGTAWTQLTLPPNTLCPMSGASRMVYMSAIDKILTTMPDGPFSSASFVFGTLSAPNCYEQPSDSVVPIHGTIEVGTKFTCVPGSTYQWYLNNTPLSGANNQVYYLSGQSVTPARSGQYKCIATSPCGVTSSNEAYIEVTCEPRTIDFDIEPSPATFTINTAFGPITINVYILGRLSVLLDPACAQGTTMLASITSVDLRTEPPIVDVPNFFGGSLLISNARLQIDDVHGEPGPAGPLMNPTPGTRQFSQTSNEPALGGVIDYDALGINGTYNLANVPPTLVDWTVGFTPQGSYPLTLPFLGSWEIDAGLPDGPLNLTLQTTLHGHRASCLPDLGASGGVPGSDGLLDNNDFIAFISYFFEGDAHADMGRAGGEPGSDSLFDNNDFIAFINAFFTGCG